MKKVLCNPYLKMNTQQIQLNRQWMIALLLTGSILSATLAWTGAEASGSIVQPTNMGQSWSHLRVVKGTKIGSTGGGDGVSFVGCKSELLPWSHLRSVKV